MMKILPEKCNHALAMRMLAILAALLLAGVKTATAQEQQIQIRVMPFSATSLGLYWRAPDDIRNLPDIEYQILRDEVSIATKKTDFYFEGDLKPQHQHQYRIAAMENGIEIASSPTVDDTMRYTPAPGYEPDIMTQQFFLRDVSSYSQCLLDTSGYVRCWGDYYLDQLRRWPDESPIASLENTGPYKSIDRNVWGHGCGINFDGSLSCFDKFAQDQPESSSPFVQVSLNWAHACALDAAGTVQCWGEDIEGQLQVPDDKGPFTAISSAGNANCAIDTDAQVQCWGGSWTEEKTRSAFPDDQSYTAISASESRTCALTDNGDLTCVDDEQSASVQGSGFKRVMVNRSTFDYEGYMCALDMGGKPHCWSNNAVDDQYFGVPENEGGFDEITVGDKKACATREDNSYLCWSSEGTFRSVFPETPELDWQAQYSDTSLEFAWTENTSTGYITGDIKTSGYDIYRNGEFLTYVTGRSLYQSELTANSQYRYEIFPVSSQRLRSKQPLVIEFNTGDNPGDNGGDPPVSNEATIDWPVQGVASGTTLTGSVLSWPNDDWYQVQSTTDYQSVCEGRQPCPVSPGTYNIINLSTAERSENVVIVAGTSNEGFGAPAKVKLLVYSDTAAELNWQRPDAGANVMGTEVVRDGVLLGIAEGNSFYDPSREPDIAYRYELTAIDIDGNRSATIMVGGQIESVKLSAGNELINNHYGISVDVDEGILVVGARTSGEDGLVNQGQVFVYDTDANHAGAEGQTFTIGTSPYGSMAVVDGDTLLAWHEGADHVTVFTADATSGQWSESQSLTMNNAQGFSVRSIGDSIAIEGNTLMIGVPVDEEVHVFTRDASGFWEHQQILSQPYDIGVYGSFGSAVSLDGDTVLIGAEGSEELGFNAGSAFIYTRDNTGQWMEQQKLLASNGSARNSFGAKAVLVNNTAVIGTSDPDYCNGFAYHNSENAYVFEKNADGQWQETQILASDDGKSGDHFGNSVAFDGTTIVVGALSGSGLTYHSGAAYAFQRGSDGDWVQTQKFVASDGLNNQKFGQSLALEEGTLFIGAHAAADCGEAGVGAVYEYKLAE